MLQLLFNISLNILANGHRKKAIKRNKYKYQKGERIITCESIYKLQDIDCQTIETSQNIR